MGLILFAVLILLGAVRHPTKLAALKSLLVAFLLTAQSIAAPMQTLYFLSLAATFVVTYFIAILCFGIGRAVALLRPVRSDA